MNLIKVIMVGNANTGKTTLFNVLTKSFLHTGNWFGVTVSGAKKSFLYGNYEIILEDLPGVYSLVTNEAEEDVTLNRLLSEDYDVVLNVCEAQGMSRNLYLTRQLKEIDANMVIAVNMADEQKNFYNDYEILSKELKTPAVSVSAKLRQNLEVLINNIITASKTHKKIDRNKLNSVLSQQYTESFYREIDCIMQNVRKPKAQDNITKTEKSALNKADKVLLSPFFALPIFACIMTAVFYFTFELAGKGLGMLLIKGMNFIIDKTETGLVKWGVSQNLRLLVTEAILKGAGSILEFLPQIAVLFLCLAVIEDSGYLARAAYILDAALEKIGLNGRAAYTLLMGFGCSASAVFTAKSIDNKAVRLKTVMISPFMSCSARITVFSAITAFFFPKYTYLIISALYLGGIIAAIIWAKILGKFIKIPNGSADFMIELPPYRLPSPKRVLKIIFHNVKLFFIRICTVIFLVNIAVWLLGNYDWAFNFVGFTGESILKDISQFLLPLFLPLGITQWKAVIAILGGLVAKETVISIMTTLGGIQGVIPNASSAISFLVFVLMYTPCVATVAAIQKELGGKWALFSILIHTVTAYISAMLTFGFAILFTRLPFNVIIVMLSLFLLGCVYLISSNKINNKKTKKLYSQ